MKERTNSTITVMRGIAIFLVVLQHALTYSDIAWLRYVSLICYYIDVNVFFFISGYLYERNNVRYKALGRKAFIKRKAKELLLPYISWSLVLYVGVAVAYTIPQLSSLLSMLKFEKYTPLQIIINIVTFQNFYIELYWFVYALFIIFLIEIGRPRVISDITLILMSIIIFSFLQNSISSYLLSKLSISLAVFIIGKIYARRNEIGQRLKENYVIYAVLVSLFIHLRRNLIPLTNIFEGVLYYIYSNTETVLLGFSGVIVCLSIAGYIEKTKNLLYLANHLGLYSYEIYLIHNPYVVAASALVLCRFLPNLIAVGLSFVLGLIVPPLIYRKLISKSSMLNYFLFGRGEIFGGRKS